SVHRLAANLLDAFHSAHSRANDGLWFCHYVSPSANLLSRRYAKEVSSFSRRHVTCPNGIQVQHRAARSSSHTTIHAGIHPKAKMLLARSLTRRSAKKLASYLSLVAAVTFPAASLATSSTLLVASFVASFTASAALSIA